MPYLTKKVVLSFTLLLLYDLINAQHTLFRLSCEEAAIFKLVGNDQRCTTGILQTKVKERVTRCYQWCSSTSKCIGANMKEENHGKVRCELIEGLFTSSKKCELHDEVGWQYFEAIFTYPSVVLNTGYCKERRNSRCTIEEMLNPKIYIPFNKLFCGKTTLYGRGHDEEGKSVVTIDGAYTEINAKISTEVIRVLNPIQHTIGNFGKHPMNNPLGYNLSVSMWIKASSYQKTRGDSFYFGCGDIDDDGFYIRQMHYGASIAAGFTDSVNDTRYYRLVTTAGRFENWKHLVLTIEGTSYGDPIIAMYLNGTPIAGTQYKEKAMYLPSTSPYLKFGKLAGFSRFAYWSRVLSPEEIAAIYHQTPY